MSTVFGTKKKNGFFFFFFLECSVCSLVCKFIFLKNVPCEVKPQGGGAL